MHLSEALQQFIIRYINSIDQLEMLLMLQREPSREWTADEITRLLFSERESISSRLEELKDTGLVAAKELSGEIRYRYAPRTPELEDAASELARDYPMYRVSIINLIFSKPIDRIRTFADAFRFKKDDEKKK
jgi:hypothetical protein